MPLSPRHSRHGTLLAVSMMKDEAPYLLEWVAHHLAVGFTDLLVYTNDCTDGTVEMLQRLEVLGLAHHRANRIPPGQKPQPSALNHAQEEPLVAASDWVMVFDADEFLSVNHPACHLDGLLDDVTARGANGLVVTWRIFGSNGVVEWVPAPVTEQFTRAAPASWNKGWGVKTLFRFDPEHWKLGIHRPSIRNKHLDGPFPDTVRWLNGSGRPVEEWFRFRGWRSIRRTLGYGWAQMNHYAVKSLEGYALRKLRGNVNLKADKYDADYWALQDRNEVEDRRILRHAPERARIMAALLQDPELARLQAAAQAGVAARLTELRQSEAFQQLRAELLAAGKRPISEVEARPAQPRDPARIAAQMSRVHGRRAAGAGTGDKADTGGEVPAALGGGTGASPEGAPPWAPPTPPLRAHVALEEGGAPGWCPNYGILLPADPGVFTEIALGLVQAGKFQRRHLRHLTGLLGGAGRVLDLGCGVALPALHAVQGGGKAGFMLHTTRPGMAEVLEAILARNGLARSPRLRVVAGPLVLPGDGAHQAAGLAACLRDFRPEVLRLSDPALLAPARLAAELRAPVAEGTLRRLLLPHEGEAQAAALRAAFAPPLRAAGLLEDPAAADTGSLLFLSDSPQALPGAPRARPA